MKLFAVFAFSLCTHFATAQRFPVINDGNDNTPIPHLQYIASLQLVDTFERFFCAGVFISRSAVLTLATCFYQQDVLLEPDQVRVVGGSEFRLERELNTYSGVLERILIHGNFSRSSLENNLAIGFLSTTIPDNNIKIIDLEDIAITSLLAGSKCDIYGWSLTTRFEGSPHLLSDEVTIEAREKCDVPSNKLTSTTICAGPYSVNGCETDDGSPLVCNRKLFGLIDFRPNDYCSKTVFDRLGTYVDLSEFHDWISEHGDGASGRVAISGLMMIVSMILITIMS